MSNPTADEAVLDALGYVEQTIYSNEDNSPAVTWTNAEVLELLGEIAERLTIDGCCEDCTHVANYGRHSPGDLS